MRIVRYQDPAGVIAFGFLAADGSVQAAAGDPFSGLQPLGIPANVLRLMSPIAPIQVLGVGLNYRRHALEAGMAVPEFPVLFVKGVNTVQDPGKPIRLPTALASHEVDYECELAVVIGRATRNVSAAHALDYVLGYIRDKTVRMVMQLQTADRSRHVLLGRLLGCCLGRVSSLFRRLNSVFHAAFEFLDATTEVTHHRWQTITKEQ